MLRLSSSGMVYHWGRRDAECGHVTIEIGGAMGLLVYMTQNDGLSDYFPMVIVSFWCSGISSKEVTTNLAAVSAKSLPWLFVCPLILLSYAGSPRLDLW
jgi:hypothetical protein